MPKNFSFWRNVTLIGLAHVALITGLVRSSHETKTNPQSVVWMNGGAGEGAAAPAKPASPPKPKSLPAPTPKPEVKDEPEEDRPVLTSATSDIQLPPATPKPTPKISPSPKVKVTPKPKQRPTPTATPKPTPKPTPKMKPTPAEKDEDKETAAEAMKKEIAKAKAVLEKDPEDTQTDAA